MNRDLVVKAAAVAALLLALILAGVMLFSSPKPQPAPAAPAGQLSASQIARMGIKTARATATTSTIIGAVSGRVILPPDARVGVTIPFTGTVARVYVMPGQEVRAGDALAQLSSVDSIKTSAALARSQAQLVVAQAEERRTALLVREGILAGARAEAARALRQQAQTDVEENRRILTQTGASGTGDIVLRAPISGRVAVVNVQTGGPVDPMSAPFIVENTQRLMLDLQIPERMVSAVKPGLGVSIHLPDGRVATGTLVTMGASLDPATRAITAQARLETASGLVSGKTVTALLKGTASAPAVRVPAAAVTRLDGKDSVFVATAKGFAVRRVTLAGLEADTAILTSGLTAGEPVAISGISELKVIFGGH
ncbi:MAG: efflux RND transporter periplasmic adaptor subunit [Alphaproteobacteria bacterium]|nr:efflux RND transporter periplasmic adaptor subunit [Alphaproteobacteria bacterium]